MKKLIILFFIIFLIGCQPVEKQEGGEKMPDVLIIIAQKGFQPVEYSDTRQEIENSGLSVEVASVTTDVAVGADNSEVKPDIAIKDVNADNYKAIVVIGGPGALSLEGHVDLLKSYGGVIGAICIAPVMLAKAGLLNGKKATVWDSGREQIKIFEDNGAEFVDSPVVVDGNLITANGPSAAKEFGKKVVEKLR